MISLHNRHAMSAEIESETTGPRDRRQSIATSLVIASLTVAAMSLLLAIVGIQALIYEPARQAVARAELAKSARQVESSLAALFKRVDTIARLRHDWGSLGLLSTEDETSAVRLLGTELTYEPSFNSVVMADENGREILLRRLADGRFMTRRTDPAVRPGLQVDSTWTADGRRLDRVERKSDYDARSRPWFRQVLDAPNDGRVVWTEPFVFRSTGQPGISAVVQWQAIDGRRITSTTDVTLSYLSQVTQDMEMGRRGYAVVVTREGRLIGLPGGQARVDSAAAGKLLMQPAGVLGQPSLDTALAKWRADEGRPSELMHFTSGGEAWIGTFSNIPLEGRASLYVAVLAPESDFALLGGQQWAYLAAILLTTLALAGWAALRMSRRFARPLQQLAAASERIGQLDLAEPVRVDSQWVEVRDTVRAQERMRARLMQATEGLEETVEKRTRQLTVAVAAADEAARAKAAFLASMSHEIRTPLNAILGLGTLLQRTEISQVQRQYLQRLDDAARLLLHIVNDVLDFSKIEAGKVSLEQAEFSLDELLQRVASIVVPTTHDKPVELVMRRAADLPNLLVGDATRLEQVLINIVGNAVKFTATGEVLVESTLESQSGEGVVVRFSVRDTGIGISVEQIQHLFEPFKQGDDSMARRFGGTGLGLAISKYLVELMDGTLRVESTPMVGSTFCVSVPLRVTGPASDPDDAKPWHVLGGLRALVVDDQETSLRAICEILESFGIFPVAMSSPQAAIQEFVLARDEGRAHDLVLVDWGLPGTTGLEVIAQMRHRVPDVRAEFIMISAADLPQVEAQIREAGLTGVITKPTTPSSLLDAILAGFRKPSSSPSQNDPSRDGRTLSEAAAHHVLLVEDNDVNALIASEFLKSAGVRVSTVESGIEAIERISSGERFDLLFMDVQMARMDGLEATRILRAMPGGAELIIVALTAHALAGDRARCLAAGMDDYLSKPLSPEALRKCLKRWLNVA